MAEAKDSCVQPAQGPVDVPVQEKTSIQEKPEEDYTMIAQVGKPAPDFEAAAFFEGGFKNIKLSDYKGQWIVVCFYPGDFTFV